MRSPLAKGAIALAAVAAIVILFVVLAGGDDESDSTATTTTTTAAPAPTTPAAPEEPARPRIERIVARGGSPVGGVKRLEFDSGERVRFAVRSDIADEVHVHGYDVTKDLPAGESVRVSFPAELEGVFEVELHDSGEQIAELRVSP